jgi:putative transposase
MHWIILVKFSLTGGNRYDVIQTVESLEGWETTRVIADKGYDAQSVLDKVATMGAEEVIPPKSKRKAQREFDKELYKERSWLSVFSIGQAVQTGISRFDRLGRNYLAFVQVASVLIWLW